MTDDGRSALMCSFDSFLQNLSFIETSITPKGVSLPCLSILVVSLVSCIAEENASLSRISISQQTVEPDLMLRCLSLDDAMFSQQLGMPLG